MRKYHKQSTVGLLGHGITYDLKYLFWPTFRDGSFVLPFIAVGLLAFNYFSYGSVFPSKEDYNSKKMVVSDSTFKDSILVDSLFIPKPVPLEDIE